MSSLKLYLDSFDRQSWQALIPTGLFFGITTNPLLAHKAGLDYGKLDWTDIISTAAFLGALELHIQVPDLSDDALSLPFLILGAVAIMASTIVSFLFERARRLNDEALGEKA